MNLGDHLLHLGYWMWIYLLRILDLTIHTKFGQNNLIGSEVSEKMMKVWKYDKLDRQTTKTDHDQWTQYNSSPASLRTQVRKWRIHSWKLWEGHAHNLPIHCACAKSECNMAAEAWVEVFRFHLLNNNTVSVRAFYTHSKYIYQFSYEDNLCAFKEEITIDPCLILTGS